MFWVHIVLSVEPAKASCFSCAGVTVNLNKTSWIMYCVQCFSLHVPYFVKRWPAGFHSRILFLNGETEKWFREKWKLLFLYNLREAAWTFILFIHKNFTLFAIYALQDEMDFGGSRLQFFKENKRIIFRTITDDTEKHFIKYIDRCRVLWNSDHKKRIIVRNKKDRNVARAREWERERKRTHLIETATCNRISEISVSVPNGTFKFFWRSGCFVLLSCKQEVKNILKKNPK